MSTDLSEIIGNGFGHQRKEMLTSCQKVDPLVMYILIQLNSE